MRRQLPHSESGPYNGAVASRTGLVCEVDSNKLRRDGLAVSESYRAVPNPVGSHSLLKRDLITITSVEIQSL